MNNDLGKYFLKAARRLRKVHKGTAAYWPEYVTSTQPKVRRVIAQAKSANYTASPVRSSVTGKYQSTLAQNIAKQQIAKSRRESFPRRITPRVVVTWGTWGVGMGIFAASLLLNAPFPLGKTLLNQVPGQPRVSQFVLETPSTTLEPGKEFVVTAKISDAPDARLYGAGFALQYNHEILDLQSIDTAGSAFRITETSENEPSRGQAHLVLRDAGVAIQDNTTLAQFHFAVRSAVGETELRFSDNAFVLVQENAAARPKNLSALTLNIQSLTLSPRTITAQTKKDAITIDGDLADWRDIISYSPASFKPQGIVLGPANIVQGTLHDARDAGGVFQVAKDAGKISFAFFADDDEITPQDVVGIKIGNTVYEIHVQEALSKVVMQQGMAARAKKIDGGYTLEASIGRNTLGRDSSASFNFEMDDFDAQSSGRLLLSSPNDSRLTL